MKKTLSLIFTVLFLAVCLVPGLGLLLTGGADAAANEILPAAPVIAADGEFNPDVLAETAAYVNGRFSFRLEGITAWAGLNAVLFHTSTAENVLLGRDGWLFYAPTIHDYTGDAPMTARELYCAARTLYLLQEYAENRGGDFLFTAAPNKNTLYSEYMPERTRLGGASNMDVLYARLDEMGVSYLDLRDVFASEAEPSDLLRDELAHSGEPLYFKTDSHWNAKGAALAADALLASLDCEGGYFANTVSAGNTHRGDLYEMLYPAGQSLEEDFTYAPGFSFTANTENSDRVTITTENDAGTGALLCYRDSFGRNLYPYLAQSFASAEFSRRNEYTAATLPEGGTLLIELVERNIRYLVEYDSLAPAPERESLLAADAEPGEGRAVLTESAGTEGYTVFSGTWDGVTPDDEANVYVLSGGALFEAVPRPDGFIVSLPDGSAVDAVYASAGGNFFRLSAVYAID